MQNIRKKSAKKYKGFTLVELIVVITILTILGTIGFVSMSGYFAGARDSTRLTDMSNIYGQMNLSLGMDGGLPLPDNYRTVTLSGTIITYQGYAGKTVLPIIKFEKGGRDPKDDTYYTYTIDRKKRLAQLMGYFEEYDTKKLSYISPIKERADTRNNILPQALASSLTDYSDRLVGTLGKSIGTLVESGTLVPVQQTSTLSLELLTATSLYTIYFDSITPKSGTGKAFTNIFYENSAVYKGISIATLCTNSGMVLGSNTTYPGCDTADIVICSGLGVGQVWSACNVGATTAYTNQFYPSGTAFTPLQKSYLGGYYQWGRNKDVTSGSVTLGPLGSDTTDNFITAPSNPFDWFTSRNDHLWGGSGTTATSGTFTLQESPTAMQGPCQSGYHVPTQKEWCDVLLSISPNLTCTIAWQSETTANLFRTTMKLPISGFRNYLDGSFVNQGTNGYYWSSSPGGTNAYNITISATQVHPLNNNNRSYGFSVRCLKN